MAPFIGVRSSRLCSEARRKGEGILIQPVGLPILDTDFTKVEIDATVKEFPSDHAPGPNGFNGFFIKKCWSIIRDDFYRLCQ
jgi:hypothetical protein